MPHVRENRVAGRQVVIVPNIIKLEAYSHLVDFLVESLGNEPDRNLMPFGYDWRRDNRESARKLAAAIDDWKRRVLGEHAKVTIIAHSMGCLVTRYFVECLGGASSVDRLILMGGPHGGSASIVQCILSGPELLPLGLGNRGLHQALMTFPSAYQLVPKGLAAEDADGKPVSLLDYDDWVDPRYRSLLRGNPVRL
jgi:pimeloyl-ACP methyl ester carboxylesterase